MILLIQLGLLLSLYETDLFVGVWRYSMLFQEKLNVLFFSDGSGHECFYYWEDANP